MKNAKRGLSVLLVMLMLFCSVPLQSTFATTNKTNGKLGDITWSYSKHTLTFSGKGEIYNMFADVEYPWQSFKESIYKVVVKDGITRITDCAFNGYKNLSKLSLSESLVDISKDSLAGTAWFKAQSKGIVYLNDIALGYKGKMPSDYVLKIKDGTRSVATDAFSSTASLKAIKLPESVTYLGDSAFAGCENLSEVIVPQTLQYAGGYALARTPWLEKQPDGMIYLGKAAYRYKGEMPVGAVIKIKVGTVSISPVAFYCEESMAGVRIPETVTKIGYNAFFGSGVKRVYFPKSVAEIQYNKIGAMFMKKIIVDPKNPAYSSDDTGCLFNKKKTQMYEFPGSSKVKQYQIPNGVKKVLPLCFVNTQHLETLMIPASVKAFEKDAVDHDCYLKAFKVDPKNPNYSSDKAGCLYNKEKTTLIRYPIARKASSFIMPKQVKTISSGAFMQAGYLQTLKMCDNVSVIGEFAFYRCYGLENIRFSKNITEIKGELFSYIPWMDKQPDGVIYIGKVAYSFRGDGKEALIKEGTVSIADYAFAGWSSIKTVRIPKSVKSIGHGAFADSTGIKTIQVNNPKCAIPMKKDTFPKKATIYAAKGSTAQTYAETFGRKFAAI